ncbi:MAG: hypothetical protein V7708_18445, partial [Oceanicoccus sp.]
MEILSNDIYVEHDCDIPGGMWKYDAIDSKLINAEKRIYVALKTHLLSVEVIGEKNDRTLGGTGAAAIVGGVLVGPLG